MEFLVKLLIFVGLFCIGWYFGGRAERKHLQQLQTAEALLSHIRLRSSRFESREQPGQLVMASVVLSHDYFKWVWAQIHNLFGGRLITYESLLDRARREAIVRLKQQAKKLGAVEILALRLVTTEIGEQGGMVEVLAYGTAILSTPRTQPAPWPPVP